ncbi:copper resistance protein NlpE N-terminal domain-containing protein [Cardiobacterium sp. Marseille-Q4385]|uniref:copper resistance protein NlpE N-terminal domain-containing protein n=1 Tax=Cardiobacterium sp. Marseille-Q4385 TaxID=2866573 RepID=UPI001CE4070E|nr:copper resistance protein NlpE N-terminal domain-containing protein [Cardiobacterium sp. Marseille-Q4385]
MKTLALATILLATTYAQAASDDSAATQIATDADTQPASDDSPETQALNHTGTYSGTLPCAVCDGIQTKLTLDDGHYHLTRIRLGLDENSEQTSGVYRTTTDKQYLQLDNQTDRLTFYIGDGYLELRQPDGEKIDPELPDEDFRLKRQ